MCRAVEVEHSIARELSFSKVSLNSLFALFTSHLRADRALLYHFYYFWRICVTQTHLRHTPLSFRCASSSFFYRLEQLLSIVVRRYTLPCKLLWDRIYAMRVEKCVEPNHRPFTMLMCYIFSYRLSPANYNQLPLYGCFFNLWLDINLF